MFAIKRAQVVCKLLVVGLHEQPGYLVGFKMAASEGTFIGIHLPVHHAHYPSANRAVDCNYS